MIERERFWLKCSSVDIVSMFAGLPQTTCQTDSLPLNSAHISELSESGQREVTVCVCVCKLETTATQTTALSPVWSSLTICTICDFPLVLTSKISTFSWFNNRNTHLITPSQQPWLQLVYVSGTLSNSRVLSPGFPQGLNALQETAPSPQVAPPFGYQSRHCAHKTTALMTRCLSCAWPRDPSNRPAKVRAADEICGEAKTREKVQEQGNG